MSLLSHQRTLIIKSQKQGFTILDHFDRLLTQVDGHPEIQGEILRLSCADDRTVSVTQGLCSQPTMALMRVAKH